MTATEARRHFGKLLDLAKHEPVAITREGRIVAYVISQETMNQLTEMRRE